MCGPLSFVTQSDDFAYVGIDRSRMDLSATTKVWIHNGVPRSAVVTFVLTERMRFGLQKHSKEKGSIAHPQKGYLHLKTQLTCENDTFLSTPKSQNKREIAKFLLSSSFFTFT